MKNFIYDLLSEGGKLSTMRVMTVVIVLGVIGVFIMHNVNSVLKGCGWIDPGVESVGVLLTVISGKVVQKFAEKKTVATEDKPATPE
jgi:hypothetical protein